LAVGDALLLPMDEILSRLPNSMAPLVRSRPGGTFSVSASEAVEQLRFGAVRVPFGQLRQASPPGTFADDASQDDSLIDLPLPLVLAALGPGRLARRADQRRVEVPDEVTGVFGPKGITPGWRAAVAAAPKSAAPASPLPAAPAPPPPVPPTPAPKPVVPTAPLPGLPKPVVPAAPQPSLPRPVVSAPSLPTLPKPVIPSPGLSRPAPSMTPGPAAPRPPAPAPLPFAGPKPASPLPFATTRPAPPARPAAAPVVAGEPVVTTIGALCEAWPQAIRQEIEKNNFKNAPVSIPLNRLEAALKAGRVVFTWGELSGWLSAPPATPSPHGETQVELPLRVIAPLFMAKHRAAAQKKVTIGDNIPDLFGGLGRAAAPAATPAPSAQPEPAAAPVAAPQPAAEADVLGEVFGQPSKTEWSPEEIAQGISAMPGVAGSLLATADGLLVAGQAQAPLNVDTLAAFLPQMFGRVAHYAGEARLGTLEALTLTVGGAPHVIFKAGPLYLAVVGKAGQALPEAALQRVAGELARRKQ
jgi:predicted regulator of Ras-like GTPase activity (Roadblock/LC7/MglB family)